jgi:hypothetical protein
MCFFLQMNHKIMQQILQLRHVQQSSLVQQNTASDPILHIFEPLFPHRQIRFSGQIQGFKVRCETLAYGIIHLAFSKNANES